VEYNERGLCQNKTLIDQGLIEREFIRSLSNNLRSNGLCEELIELVFNHVQAAKKRGLASEGAAEERRKELEKARSTQVQYKDNLVRAVKQSGGMKSLYEELAQVERSITQIDERLAELNRPAAPEITIDEVRQFVETQISNLEQVLQGASELLKIDFQRRISKIIVTPDNDENGRFFRITGDVELFVEPEGVVQTNSVDLIGLHYTFPVSLNVRPHGRGNCARRKGRGSFDGAENVAGPTSENQEHYESKEMVENNPLVAAVTCIPDASCIPAT
jgi:hypothetical protein